MFNFWFCFVGVVSLLLYIVWLIPTVTSHPLGPPNWPIVGSLFYLSKLAFEVLPNSDCGRGRKKDRLLHKVWLIRILGDAFWAHQCTRHILHSHEWHFPRMVWWFCSRLHRRHFDLQWLLGGAWGAPLQGVPKAKGKQVVCQVWEVRIWNDGSGLPWT